MSNFVLLLFAVLVIICGCDERSTIDERSELVDEEILVSAGGNFAMGFFLDDAVLNWYVGIWYYNRPGVDDDKSGVKAELLVLFDESGTKVWESFRNPTNTFLPGMNMENLEIISWVESGNWKYKFKVDKKDNKKYVIVENGVDEARRTLLNISSLANHSNKDSIFEHTRLLMNSNGEIKFYFWDNERGWSVLWSAPKDKCDEFRKCGKFEICNSNERQVCRCLPGFQSHPQEYYGDGSTGDCSQVLLCIKSTSPFYLHSSESAESSLLPAMFDGGGYRSWRRAVLRALSVKGKT
ncbi:hypothetical protein KY285_031128 [Solanum tuberosum]|nr:hypothetical protein KY285_031128 [Solanum tuberosum]